MERATLGKDRSACSTPRGLADVASSSVKSAAARQGVVLSAILAGACAIAACSGNGSNHGVFSFGVTGRVSNPAGTCVTTKYSGPYSHDGEVCAGTRLGTIGQCVRFGVSNLNAAHSSLPAIGGVAVVDSAQCTGL